MRINDGLKPSEKVDCSMEHSEQTFLGIDLGTSAMKLVLIDDKKNVLAQMTEEYRIAQPEQGYNEIDPIIWYDCMIKAMRRLFEKYPAGNIKGIGVTGQMHTLVTLDENGAPVRPALMWNDIRTKDLIPGLKEIIKEFPEGAYLSKTISTGSPAANLYWLKLNEPENFRRVKKFLIGPDYLVYRLTGHCGTDYCEASTSCLYRIKARKWSEEMKELIGLDDEVYPEIHGSVISAGRIKKGIADALGLDPDTDVLTGTGDNPATAISTGCLGQGYPVISLGTSGVLMMTVPDFRDDAMGKMILFSFDDKEYSYLVQGAVQSNGSTFDWLVKNILNEDYSNIDRLVEERKLSEGGLIFYPHLMGDKTLYADPNLRGAFIGLSTETTRADMLYAVIQGLCFSFRELAEKMRLPLDRFGSVKVVGGGSKSRAWMQTLSNVLDIRIEQLNGNVGPAFGIALLAAYRHGAFPSLEKISEGSVIVNNCFEPQEAAVKACGELYEKYLRVHKALNYITNG